MREGRTRATAFARALLLFALCLALSGCAIELPYHSGEDFGISTAVSPVDFDGDGKNELVVLSEHHVYAYKWKKDNHLEEIAKQYGIPNTARLPIDPAIARSCDAGAIEAVQSPWLDSMADAIAAL